MHPLRVDLDQGLRQEVGLLLVVALEADAVTRLQRRFEQRSNAFGRDEFADQL
jgi:hypothetical protein